MARNKPLLIRSRFRSEFKFRPVPIVETKRKEHSSTRKKAGTMKMPKKRIKTKMKSKVKKLDVNRPRKVGGIWIDPTCYSFFDYKESK